jgi:hypothetical protein
MLILQQPRQPFQGALESLPQPAALRNNPILIQTGEEIAFIERNSLLQKRALLSTVTSVIGPTQRIFEPGYVQIEGGRVTPAEPPTIDIEKAISFRKGVSETVEEIAQVSKRLILGRIRPEEERQAMARRGRLAVEQEVGQQRLEAGGIDRRQRLITEQEPEATQQFNAEHRLRSFLVHF